MSQATLFLGAMIEAGFFVADNFLDVDLDYGAFLVCKGDNIWQLASMLIRFFQGSFFFKKNWLCFFHDAF